MCKKKIEKVTYYDDGSTISDMSNVKRGGLLSNSNNASRPKTTEKEKLKTFFKAFKMMLVPTGVALLVLLILYIIFMLIGVNAS